MTKNIISYKFITEISRCSYKITKWKSFSFSWGLTSSRVSYQMGKILAVRCTLGFYDLFFSFLFWHSHVHSTLTHSQDLLLECKFGNFKSERNDLLPIFLCLFSKRVSWVHHERGKFCLKTFFFAFLWEKFYYLIAKTR